MNKKRSYVYGGHKINCTICGKQFIGYSHGFPNYKSKYCSKKCRNNRFVKIKHKCPMCKKIFITDLYWKNQVFCSCRCAGISRRGIVNPIKRICKACKKVFFVPRCLKNKKYCSWRCYHRRRNHPIIKICIMCRKKFKTYRGVNEHKCCSWKCRTNWIKSINNPNYRHGLGYLPYSNEFSKSLKNKIKIRDHVSCKLCNNSRRELHIHHIDGNKFNNNINNLITLCNKCHYKTYKNLDYWKEKLGGYIHAL